MFFARRFCGEHISCRSFLVADNADTGIQATCQNLAAPAGHGRTITISAQPPPEPFGVASDARRFLSYPESNVRAKPSPPAKSYQSVKTAGRRFGVPPGNAAAFLHGRLRPVPGRRFHKNRKDGITGLGCYTVLADACTFGRRLCGLWDVRFSVGFDRVGEGSMGYFRLPWSLFLSEGKNSSTGNLNWSNRSQGSSD